MLRKGICKLEENVSVLTTQALSFVKHAVASVTSWQSLLIQMTHV